MHWFLGLLGLLIAVVFGLAGFVTQPDNIVQQQVQHLDWIISALGWVILGIGSVVEEAARIRKTLTKMQVQAVTAPSQEPVTVPSQKPKQSLWQSFKNQVG